MLNIMLSSVFSGVCVCLGWGGGGQRQCHVIVITRFSTCLILCKLVLQFSWHIFGTDKEGGIEYLMRGRGISIQCRLLLQLL